ncbi:MAG: beta-eliminating lyase-related protein [Planctomycetota bacterium]
MAAGKTPERVALRARSKWVHGHRPQTPAEVLRRAADWCEDRGYDFDVYGSGPLIEEFEAKVAELLGFPAARFMPTGKVAQNVAMRVWAERARIPHFGMPPTSHLELHEERAYAHLFGLRATLVGPADRPMRAEHLRAVPEALAALLVELPTREAGGQLPTWDELVELKQEAAARGVPLHLDGARLWECAAHYRRGYDEICAGFDSVYVSFYKGIDALSGAMLLGSEDFIEESAVWQARAGGRLYTLAPNVATAAMQFDERLARMPEYHAHAVAIAEAAGAVEGVTTLPRVPHVNLMHVFVALDADAAYVARDRVAEEHGVWLFNQVKDAEIPGHVRFEWYVGDNALEIDPAVFGACFADLMAH